MFETSVWHGQSEHSPLASSASHLTDMIRTICSDDLYRRVFFVCALIIMRTRTTHLSEQ